MAPTRSPWSLSTDVDTPLRLPFPPLLSSLPPRALPGKIKSLIFPARFVPGPFASRSMEFSERSSNERLSQYSTRLLRDSWTDRLWPDRRWYCTRDSRLLRGITNQDPAASFADDPSACRTLLWGVLWSLRLNGFRVTHALTLLRSQPAGYIVVSGDSDKT